MMRHILAFPLGLPAAATMQKVCTNQSDKIREDNFISGSLAHRMNEIFITIINGISFSTLFTYLYTIIPRYDVTNIASMLI